MAADEHAGQRARAPRRAARARFDHEVAVSSVSTITPRSISSSRRCGPAKRERGPRAAGPLRRGQRARAAQRPRGLAAAPLDRGSRALPAADHEAALRRPTARRATAAGAGEREREARLVARRTAARRRAPTPACSSCRSTSQPVSKSGREPALEALRLRQRMHAQRDLRDHAERALRAGDELRAAPARRRWPGASSVAQLAERRRAAHGDEVRRRSARGPVESLAGRARRHAAADVAHS